MNDSVLPRLITIALASVVLGTIEWTTVQWISDVLFAGEAGLVELAGVATIYAWMSWAGMRLLNGRHVVWLVIAMMCGYGVRALLLGFSDRFYISTDLVVVAVGVFMGVLFGRKGSEPPAPNERFFP